MIPSSTTPPTRANLDNVDDVLAWIQDGGDAPAQVTRNEEARIQEADTTATADSSSGTVTLIHKDDDIEPAFAWSEKADGRITAARLAKRLPNTAQLLRDREITSDAVTEELVEPVIARSKAAAERRGARRQLGRDGSKLGCLAWISKSLVSFCYSSPSEEEDQPFFLEVLIDLHSKLRRAVLQAAENDDSRKASERIALTDSSRQASL